MMVLSLSLPKRLCSVDKVYRGWGKQGFLVKNVQCHLINNTDKFLKLAEYCIGVGRFRILGRPRFRIMGGGGGGGEGGGGGGQG